MIFNVTSGGGAAAVGSWAFTTATAKPAAVAKRTMLAVCATAPATITVSDAEPESPVVNDVWFHITNPADGRAMSDGSVPMQCLGAYQYVSDAWALVTAYYSYLGVWWELPGLPAPGTALENCTWAQIDRVCKAGKANANDGGYFCIGDEKTITLSTAEVVTLQIIGFAHDDLSAAGGGKAPITFGFKECLNATQKMNATATNVGGYSGCALYQTINGAIYETLPSELKAVMKDVNKSTGAGNNLASIVVTQEKLFLPAKVEVLGDEQYATPGEGSQYPFFTNGGAQTKLCNGTASTWWTRSPAKIGSSVANFCHVSASGGGTHLAANTLAGVALALCV